MNPVGRPPYLPFLVSLVLAGACQRGQVTPRPDGAPAAAPRPAQASSPSPGGQGQLALVRPAEAPCLGRARPSTPVLVARAAAELEGGAPGRALVCADEALRLQPRLVPGLELRAAALTALGRVEEARLAYAQALAVDPDDPDTLHGAADLYVTRLSGDRAQLELGREYALRGARAAQRPPRPDRELAGRLLVIAAMAENDLGESPEALEHAGTALALLGDDPDAHYERGVALYELCRFAEARAALERVLSREPEDAWTLHYLSLVAERTGRAADAEALERRARTIAPDDFGPPLDVDRAAFEHEVRRAVAALPEAERGALATVPVEVAEVPSLDDLTAVDPPLSPSILGLFRGPSEGEACLPEDGPRCRSIVFYRRNLIRFARTRGELEEQVRVTLLHELGHLHGESDEELRARGLE